MELDDIKKTWDELNTKLEQQQQLNEKLVMKMTREKSHNKLRTIAIMEYANLVFFVLTYFFVIPRYYMLNHDIEKVAFFVLLAITTIGGVFSVLLISKIDKINYFKTPVIDKLRQISELKILFNKYKKSYYIILIPYTIVVILIIDPLLLKRGFYEHFQFYVTPLIFAIALAIVIVYVIFKKLYEQKIDEAEDLLQDIKKED